MYIKLTNFKCYANKRFDFDDYGIFLLCGNSGNGKSTILSAINFCLFGTGTKIIKWGEKSCSVELSFNDIHVIRTNRPNRLIVNGEYEDDVGQNIINEKFGTMFNITGYIEQKAENSFVMMSPIEKLHFLEKFSFNDVNVNDIKIRCKSLMTRRQLELNKTQSQLEISKNYLNEITEPEEIQFPLGNVKNKEIAMKNEEIRYKNCETKIKKSNNIISKYENEMNDLRVLNTYIESKTENIDSIISRLSDIKLEEAETEYIGDEEIEEYKNRLKSLLNSREALKLKERIENDEQKLNEMKENEINEMKSEINKITESLWTEYTKDELEELINDTKSSLKDSISLSYLRKQYNEIDEDEFINEKYKLKELKNELEQNKELVLKYDKTFYKCPSCDKNLQFCNNNLSVVDIDLNEDINIDEIKSSIKKIELKIKSIEKSISTKETIIEQNTKIEKSISDIVEQYENENDLDSDILQEYINELETYNETQNRLEKKINEINKKIEDNKFSSSILIFQKDLNKQKIELKNIENDEMYEDEYMTEEELRDIIVKEERNKEKFKNIEKKRKVLENDRMNQMKSIDSQKSKYIEKYEKIRDEEDILNNINEQKDLITENENNKIIHLDNLRNIEKYKKYVEEQIKYDNYKKKVSDLEEKEIEDTEKYNAVVLLKEKILESEMIAIINTVETINTHAQMYLDSFFQDNPISITLKCFKESKKSEKPQINMEIFYKENECDIKSISGGEFDRVVLAFTLALSDMFNTPMLMLDECTAGLDEHTTAIVFETIREHMKNKPVFVIGHQIVQGIFDKIINI